jgi:hypothetical protein
MEVSQVHRVKELEHENARLNFRLCMTNVEKCLSRWTAVCTENLIGIDRATESATVSAR